MTTLVLDLETVPSDVEPSPPKPNMANEVLSRLADFDMGSEQNNAAKHDWLREVRVHPGTFDPPPCHQIVCAGAALLDENLHVTDLDLVRGEMRSELPSFDDNWNRAKDEAAIVRKLSLILESIRPRIVTWNGRGFDLPVILTSAARHGIAFPWLADRWQYRYSEEVHVDLCDWWQHKGSSPRFSLVQAQALAGLPGKPADGTDGSKVNSMIKEGRLKDVETYCLSDVAGTVGVLLRTQLVRGKITLEAYKSAAMCLLEKCESDERVRWFADKTDRKRFLLEG